MKRRVLVLLGGAILVLLVGAACAAHPASALESTGDGGWVWQHGLGAGVDYTNVVFADAANGWAVGSEGRIMHTFDGGATWYKQRSGTEAFLIQVAFADARHGWAIGTITPPFVGTPTGGAVLRTADGGDSWDQVSGLPSGFVPRSVAFTSATNGWMDGGVDGGGELLHSTDGGETWAHYAFPNDQTPTGLGHMVFADPQTGWLVGGGDIGGGGNVMRTTDGGQSWVSSSTGCPYSGGALACDGDQTVIAGGLGGVFCRSTDGGQSWTQGSCSTFDSIAAITFADPTHVWATTGNGGILRSTDAGATWRYVTAKPWDLAAITFTDPAHGWAVGGSGSMIFTQDGGASWTTAAAQPADQFWGVSFPSAANGWAVAFDGVVERTTDGGASWRTPCVPRPKAFDAVSSAGTAALAVGTGGSIAKTTDGGATWSGQDAGTSADLDAVQFLDADHGCAIGSHGTVLWTTNGGATWRDCESGSAATLTGVDLLDAQHGWVVGDRTLLATADGGQSWRQLTVDASAPRLDHVDFVNASDGWVSSGTDLYRTTDGGATWDYLTYGGWPIGFGALHFSDALHGRTLAAGGQTWLTTDGGDSWTKQTDGWAAASPSEQIIGGDVVGAEGWAVGDHGTVLHSTDSGATWQPLTSTITEDLYAVAATGAGNAIAVGNAGTLLSTTDEGATWAAGAFGVPQDLDSITALDGDTAWAVGQYGIARTTDGGLTWSYDPPGFPAGRIDFVDASHGWAVGYDGTLAHSTDGGATWQPQSLGIDTEEMLSDVFFLNKDVGWLVGVYGPLYKTSDGGATWLPQGGPGMSVRAITFADQNDGWVVGATGMIEHSTDGGASWTPQTSNTTKVLSCVTFANAERGWAGGEDGTVLDTSDGGATWTPEDTGTTQWISDIACAGPDTAWLTGESGAILATTNGGLPAPDSLAPVTTVQGASATWVDRPDVALKLIATDPTSGSLAGRSGAPGAATAPASSAASGVQLTAWALADGPTDPHDCAWHAGDRLAVTGQGAHIVYYRSIDYWGNAETVKSAKVDIDTLRPTPRAPYTSRVARGRTAALRYMIADPRPGSPTASVTVRVRNGRGKTVKLVSLKARKVDVWLAYSFRCSLAKGTYRFSVSATDAAGNVQTAAAHNRLIVR
jgi:photosystem II stability/assembly factor-like uncharacterized protein